MFYGQAGLTITMLLPSKASTYPFEQFTNAKQTLRPNLRPPSNHCHFAHVYSISRYFTGDKDDYDHALLTFIPRRGSMYVYIKKEYRLRQL